MLSGLSETLRPLRSKGFAASERQLSNLGRLAELRGEAIMLKWLEIRLRLTRPSALTPCASKNAQLQPIRYLPPSRLRRLRFSSASPQAALGSFRRPPTPGSI